MTWKAIYLWMPRILSKRSNRSPEEERKMKNARTIREALKKRTGWHGQWVRFAFSGSERLPGERKRKKGILNYAGKTMTSSPRRRVILIRPMQLQ